LGVGAGDEGSSGRRGGLNQAIVQRGSRYGAALGNGEAQAAGTVTDFDLAKRFCALENLSEAVIAQDFGTSCAEASAADFVAGKFGLVHQQHAATLPSQE